MPAADERVSGPGSRTSEGQGGHRGVAWSLLAGRMADDPRHGVLLRSSGSVPGTEDSRREDSRGADGYFHGSTPGTLRNRGLRHTRVNGLRHTAGRACRVRAPGRHPHRPRLPERRPPRLRGERLVSARTEGRREAGGRPQRFWWPWTAASCMLGGVTFVPGPGPYGRSWPCAGETGDQDAGCRTPGSRPGRRRGSGAGLRRTGASRGRLHEASSCRPSAPCSAAHRLYERLGFAAHRSGTGGPCRTWTTSLCSPTS